jgi:adenylate cyclase
VTTSYLGRFDPSAPPAANGRYLRVAVIHNGLTQWEQAIEWCNRSRAGRPNGWCAVVGLAAANALAGHNKEATEAVAQLQRVYSGFTVRTWAGAKGQGDFSP